LTRLSQQQSKTTGSFDGAKTSITSSLGESLKLETTALGLMVFMKDGGFSSQVEDGMHFIMASIKNGGSFGGSTQATILCLKALILYYDTHLELKQSADFTLSINDKEVKTLKFKNSTTKLDFPVLSEDNLTSLASDNLIELSMTPAENSQGKDFALSYLLEVEYFDTRPPSASDAKIEFHLRYLAPIDSLDVG
jgi:alpha-2-macroglobulin-like protein